MIISRQLHILLQPAYIPNLYKVLMNEIFQYPDDTLIPLLYKFIYKYESIDNITQLSDKKIITYISKNSLSNFEKAFAIIKKTGVSLPPKNNGSICSLLNECLNEEQPQKGIRLEKRTQNSTFLNSLLFHLRNALAHANFKDVNTHYKLYDYNDRKITAFGYIEKNIFIQFLMAFTEE